MSTKESRPMPEQFIRDIDSRVGSLEADYDTRLEFDVPDFFIATLRGSNVELRKK
jgi:hypothetical protein